VSRENSVRFGNPGSADRDEQANREVAAILADLPADHFARRAFIRGRSTADITAHLRDRRDLAHKMMNASWDCYRRTRRVTTRNN
jgi:hypothetical protein